MSTYSTTPTIMSRFPTATTDLLLRTRGTIPSTQNSTRLWLPSYNASSRWSHNAYRWSDREERIMVWLGFRE